MANRLRVKAKQLSINRTSLWNGIQTMWMIYRVAKKKPEQSILLGLCSDQQLSFFTLLDHLAASFPHYNNTKIIKFGWELFILWAISYGLSFSGFAINL